MLKRYFAPLLIIGLVLGGGAVAWARSDAARPTVVSDLTAAVSADGTSGAAASPPDPGARRAAVQKCLADAGYTKGTPLTAEQRQTVKQCLLAAGIKGGRGRKGAAGILGRAVHGTLVVKGKGGQFETVTYDRGKETSLDGSKLTITRPDGPTVTVTLTKDTKFRGIADASALQSGRPTVVVSDKDGNALVVGQRDKAAPSAGTAGAPSAANALG